MYECVCGLSMRTLVSLAIVLQRPRHFESRFQNVVGGTGASPRSPFSMTTATTTLGSAAGAIPTNQLSSLPSPLVGAGLAGHGHVVQCRLAAGAFGDDALHDVDLSGGGVGVHGLLPASREWAKLRSPLALCQMPVDQVGHDGALVGDGGTHQRQWHRGPAGFHARPPARRRRTRAVSQVVISSGSGMRDVAVGKSKGIASLNPKLVAICTSKSLPSCTPTGRTPCSTSTTGPAPG